MKSKDTIMKKILVTTDLSDNSKSGLQFAIQLSSQQKYGLTFFHCYNILIPTSWTNTRIADYRKAETHKIQEKLELFVDSVYKRMNIARGNNKCIIESTVFTQSTIMEYALKNNFNFICMSTRGAGKIARFLGTNTANLITQSEVPVIAVPAKYKPSAIKNILYASDFASLEKELNKVVAFSKPLNAKVELLHFVSPLESVIDKKVLEMAVKKLSKYDIKLSLKNRNYVQTLISDIESAVRNTKPSMIIMFTEQNRSLFQKIFLSSNAAEYAYNPKVPLLVFNKA